MGGIEYTEELGLKICMRLADGESLRSICRGPDMPNRSNVFRWVLTHEDFRAAYEQARDIQADALADDLIDIADDGNNDWMERKGEEGQTIGWQVNGEHINRSRLRLDARKWIASKLKPKKYGDKIEQTHQGPNGQPIMISAVDAEL